MATTEMSAPDEGHGWAVVRPTKIVGADRGTSLASLHIGTLPGRKQFCLYGHLGSPGSIDVYAFFPTKAKALKAMAILDQLMEVAR